MAGAIWIQSCSMKNKTACCVLGDTGSCCEGSTFEWAPGYIVAVINGDGTNRLTPYVDVNGSTQGATSTTASQTSTSSASGSANTTSSDVASSNGASAASALATASPTPSSAPSSTTPRTVGLAVGIPVGIIALAILAAFVVAARRLKQQRAHTKHLEEKLTYAETQRHGNSQHFMQSPPPGYAQPRNVPYEMPGEVAASEIGGEGAAGVVSPSTPKP